MSALLLTVVILGVCVAAVVADVLWGSDQPATPGGSVHRDYGAPWQEWLRAVRDGVVRLGRRLRNLGSAVVSAGRDLGRTTAASSKAGGELVRHSVEAVEARRRARAQRQSAHARYVAHLEALSQRQEPEPYPLPPTAPLEAEPFAPPEPPFAPPASTVPPPSPVEAPADVRQVFVPAPADTWPPPAGPPLPPPAEPVRSAVRSTTDTLPPAAASPPPAAPAAPATRTITAPGPVDRAPLVPVQPPWRVRIRSAVVLMALVTLLGAVATGLVLASLLLVVEILAGL